MNGFREIDVHDWLSLLINGSTNVMTELDKIVGIINSPGKLQLTKNLTIQLKNLRLHITRQRFDSILFIAYYWPPKTHRKQLGHNRISYKVIG